METLLNASIRVENSIERTVDVSRYNLHCNSNILPFYYHTLVYRLMQTKCISLKLATRDTRYNSRPVIDYEIPHTARCQKLPFYYTATQWNSVSAEIKLSPLIENFKNIVKTKLLNNTIWTILIPSDNEYCNITKMDFGNITLVPLKVFKVSKFTINSHSIRNIGWLVL